MDHLTNIQFYAAFRQQEVELLYSRARYCVERAGKYDSMRAYYLNEAVEQQQAAAKLSVFVRKCVGAN